MAKPNLLIVGVGSVGQRHAENFHNIGCSLSYVDPREDRTKSLSERICPVHCFSNIKDAFGTHVYDGVVICSPPKYHVEQACHSITLTNAVLLEKPIGMGYLESKELMGVCSKPESGKRREILVGYTWRWWEALNLLRSIVQQGELGQIYHAQFHISAHLADWHPWENYQEFFMASRELGGGALLDESHWIDQMIWLFGMPEKVAATVDKISDLEITSDDSVEMLAIYPDGLKVFIHLDLYGRPNQKSIKVVGSKGILDWEESANCVRVRKDNREEEECFEFSHQRNDMFVAVAREFIRVINGAKPETCSLQDGLNVMRVIEAIRLSSGSHRFVSLQELV